MKKDNQSTPAGKSELENELAELIAQRPAIAERIATARAFGDLSENQEYTDALVPSKKPSRTEFSKSKKPWKMPLSLKPHASPTKVSIGATVEITMSGKIHLHRGRTGRSQPARRQNLPRKPHR